MSLLHQNDVACHYYVTMTSQRHFVIMITLSLRHVAAGNALDLKNNWITYNIHVLELYDDVKWKTFLCYWPFGRGIHQSLMDYLHNGPVTHVLMFYMLV